MYSHQMGNEASSVHIHSALTAEDLKALRSHFPGGGNSLEVKFNLLQYVHFKCILIWNPREIYISTKSFYLLELNYCHLIRHRLHLTSVGGLCGTRAKGL